MKALFLDCFAGISGDMFLGALIDAGLKPDILYTQLKQLNLDGYNLLIDTTVKNGIRGSKINIQITSSQSHRYWEDIKSIIINSTLPDNIKNNALKIFGTLANAEAKVHGIPVEKVYFHESGAIDTIIDIVGAAIAIETLQPDIVYCRPLPLGGGFIDCQHGRLPVPAPATTEILKGIPVYMGPVNKELVTPTGAAIVKVLVNKFDHPEICIEKIGYGFGNRDTGIFNALRVMVGEINIDSDFAGEEIIILECNIDDMNPEFTPYLQNLLLKAGALDVFVQSIVMKKGRLGSQIKVLCHAESYRSLIEIIFRETTTLGIRLRKEKRVVTRRKIIKVSTPYGAISIKTGFFDEQKLIQYAPEFEECKAAAERHNVPIKMVYASAIAEFEKLRQDKTFNSRSSKNNE